MAIIKKYYIIYKNKIDFNKHELIIKMDTSKKPINTGGQIVYTSDIKSRNTPYVSQTFKQKKSYTIYGKKWYSKLIQSNSSYYRGLYDDYSKESIVGHLIICYTRKWYDDLDHLYLYFESFEFPYKFIISFYKFIFFIKF
jgi:hypothetical protein